MDATPSNTLMLCLLGVSLGHAIRVSPTLRIAQGHSMDIEQAPYMAALLEVFSWPDDIQLRCGGTIIHPYFILTAAQCLIEKRKMKHRNNIVIQVGTSSLDSGETRELLKVEKLFIHEQFQGTNFDYDIGLVKLVDPLTYGPNVDEILLADDTVLTSLGIIGNVTGWGSANMDDIKNIAPSEELHQLEMSVRRAEDCAKTFDTFSADKEICLWKIDAGPCIGDGGGPFTVDGMQVGIISRGSTCGFLPTVLVKVAPHLTWIDNILDKNLKT